MNTTEAIDKKFTGVVDAVSYWLGYQINIGREELIHEASLRYPIADSITSTGINIRRVVLEKPHPLFKNKLIDLVIYGSDVNDPKFEKDDIKLKEAYEFKLAKYETSLKANKEYQNVFNDVVRLAYYHKWSGKDCYFLMCGNYEDFKTFFVGQSENKVKDNSGKTELKIKKNDTINVVEPPKTENWTPDGLYKNWFDFRIGESKEIEFHKNADPKSELSVFQDKYEKVGDTNSWENSLKIKTRCMAITPSGLENIRTHAAGIWKIESA